MSELFGLLEGVIVITAISSAVYICFKTSGWPSQKEEEYGKRW